MFLTETKQKRPIFPRFCLRSSVLQSWAILIKSLLDLHAVKAEKYFRMSISKTDKYKEFCRRTIEIPQCAAVFWSPIAFSEVPKARPNSASPISGYAYENKHRREWFQLYLHVFLFFRSWFSHTIDMHLCPCIWRPFLSSTQSNYQ